MDPLHDRLELADAASPRLMGTRLQVSPMAGLMVKARLVVPVSPFTEEMTTVELPVTPAITETVGGLAVMLKS